MGRTTKIVTATVCQGENEPVYEVRQRGSKRSNRDIKNRNQLKKKHGLGHKNAEQRKALIQSYKKDCSLLQNQRKHQGRGLQEGLRQHEKASKEVIQLQMARKRLQRRESLGQFKGNRNRTARYKRQFHPEYQKNLKHSIPEGTGQWYCPSCCDDSQYGWWPSWMRQELAYQDLGDIADRLIYSSGDAVFEQLQHRDMWDYFDLQFGFARITNYGMECFSLGLWDGLLQLELGDNKIGDIGCKFLARMELPLLTHLDLGKNPIRTEGMNYLSRAELPSLEKLTLNNNSGLSYLCKAHFPRLQVIELNMFEVNQDIKNNNIRNFILLLSMEQKTISIKRSKGGRRRYRYQVMQNRFYYQRNNHFVSTGLTSQFLLRIYKERGFTLALEDL